MLITKLNFDIEFHAMVVTNGYASTNPIATGHQSHLVYHKVVY